MKLKGQSKGVFEFEIKPKTKFESFYWLLFLNDSKAYIPKIVFKHNQQGKLRLNVFIKNEQSLNVMKDIDLRVRTEMNK